MPSLQDEVQEIRATISKKVSIWERLLASLNEQDRKDLMKIMNDHSIPISVIHRALRGRGFRISASSLTVARRGEK